MTRRFLILALALAGSSVSAQTVRLHVLADSVIVGERFDVAVAVEHGAGVEVLFPDPPGAASRAASPLRAGDAELLDIRRLPPDVRGIARVDSAVIVATTFALDSSRVGPVTIRLVQGGDTTAVRSPVGFVSVRSLVPADAEGAQGLAALAAFPQAWGPWLIAGLLALALLLALWWWLQRRRESAVETSTLPPHDELLVRLGRLETSQPKSDAAVKPFYVELSDTLRTYLARSLGVPARELTSRELLVLLDEHEDVPEDAHAALGDVLRRADFVKFAEFIPTPDLHATTLTRARRAFVLIEDALRPEPEPEAEPA